MVGKVTSTFQAVEVLILETKSRWDILRNLVQDNTRNVFPEPCAFWENADRAGSLPISSSNERVIPKMERGRRPLRAHEVNQTALFQRVPARGRDFPLFAEFRTFLRHV